MTPDRTHPKSTRSSATDPFTRFRLGCTCMVEWIWNASGPDTIHIWLLPSSSCLDPFWIRSRTRLIFKETILPCTWIDSLEPILSTVCWLYKNIDNHPTHLTKRIQICGKHWELCLMQTNCFTFCLPSWSLIHLFVWFLGKFTHVQQKKVWH